jgi:hypothetical protein
MVHGGFLTLNGVSICFRFSSPEELNTRKYIAQARVFLQAVYLNSKCRTVFSLLRLYKYRLTPPENYVLIPFCLFSASCNHFIVHLDCFEARSAGAGDLVSPEDGSRTKFLHVIVFSKPRIRRAIFK